MARQKAQRVSVSAVVLPSCPPGLGGFPVSRRCSWGWTAASQLLTGPCVEKVRSLTSTAA
ncbi:Hypothetical predicted protein, partial [Marmota monax]